MSNVLALINRISALTKLLSARRIRKKAINLLSAAVLPVVLSTVHFAHGAEFEAHPSLAVSEEFTDNVFVTESNRVSDFITRALPGLVLSYNAPALNGNLGYMFDYRHYARKSHEDEITHALNAKGHLTAVQNFLFLDVSDEYQRVSLDVTRDVTSESLYFNQSDRNVFIVSPHLVFYPTERIMVKAKYKFIDTRYFNSSAIDKRDHVTSLDLAYELSKRFSLTAGYTFTRETAIIDNLSQHQALGGFRYEYSDKSFFFAKAGNTWTSYDSGQHLNSIVWDAGITHAFDTVIATIITGVKYDEDPSRNIIQQSFVNGNIVKHFQRGTLTLTPFYSEYVRTETDTLDTKKYGATALGRYEILSNLNGKLAFTVEKYEYPQSYTRRFLVDSGISFPLAEQLTASLSYVYVAYYSPGIAADNYYVNRGMIEIKKIF